MIMNRLLCLFLIFRIASVFLIETSFVADEYWQSLEVAHRMVYGYGYITWEWKFGLRSFLYPFFLSLLFRLLSLLNFDIPYLLVKMPRILQSVLSAIADVYTCKLSEKLYGKSSVPWTAACLLSSWFLFYCMSRTLYNTIETVLVMIGMFYYPWTFGNYASKDLIKVTILVLLVCTIRPTAAIIWAPLTVWFLLREGRKLKQYFYVCSIIGIIFLWILMLIEKMHYGYWILTPGAFLKFNLLSDLSSHYGVHPWHWYFTSGLPQILTTHLPVFLASCLSPGNWPIALLVLWTVAVYSLSGHKEIRFLLPLIPLMMCATGSYLRDKNLSSNHAQSKWPLWIVGLLFISNVPLMFYFGWIHQRGSLEVVKWISEQSRSDHNMTVFFLTPCHTTPYYSHVHKDIHMRFLTCEPNLLKTNCYKDEADQFYQCPSLWLEQTFQYCPKREMNVCWNFTFTIQKDILPTHLVLFDTLAPQLIPFLKYGLFHKKEEFFYAYFHESRQGRYLQVWERSFRNKNSSDVI